LQDAEEAVAAGIAAIGGKTQPAFHKNEGAIFDAFAGDMLEIEIAAAGTVRVAFEGGSDSPGMKSVLAAVASPRTQAGRSEHEVENSVAVRAKTIVTATLRTNHRYSECVPQNTEKRVRGQGGDNTDRQLSHNCEVAGMVAANQTQAQPSGMDIAALLGDNFAGSMRQAPRPRRLNEFDPEYAR